MTWDDYRFQKNRQCDFRRLKSAVRAEHLDSPPECLAPPHLKGKRNIMEYPCPWLKWTTGEWIFDVEMMGSNMSWTKGIGWNLHETGRLETCRMIFLSIAGCWCCWLQQYLDGTTKMTLNHVGHRRTWANLQSKSIGSRYVIGQHWLCG